MDQDSKDENNASDNTAKLEARASNTLKNLEKEKEKSDGPPAAADEKFRKSTSSSSSSWSASSSSSFVQLANKKTMHHKDEEGAGNNDQGEGSGDEEKAKDDGGKDKEAPDDNSPAPARPAEESNSLKDFNELPSLIQPATAAKALLYIRYDVRADPISGVRNDYWKDPGIMKQVSDGLLQYGGGRTVDFVCQSRFRKINRGKL